MGRRRGAEAGNVVVRRDAYYETPVAETIFMEMAL
jgi:hypothetical protein